MTIRISSVAAILLGLALAPTAALAHAMLQDAVPPVGGTVSGSPAALQLHYSEGVEPRFSGVTLKGADGGAVPLGRPSVSPSDPTTMVVKVGRRLQPGTYTVTWRAVSVDTHKTQGSFQFTVSP